METISVNDTRKILNDTALARLVIKVASRTPHMSRYAGLAMDEPLSLRAIKKYGVSWISVWFAHPSSYPQISTTPNPIQLNTPVGEVHSVQLLQLQIRSTRIHRANGDRIVGMKLGVGTGVLYFQDEKQEVRRHLVEEGSQVYTLLEGPGLRLNFL